MKKTLLFSLIFFLNLSPLLAQAIHYIKEGGSGNGSSWANASGSVQNMLTTATDGDEIWVAEGSYYSSGSGIVMKNGVALYGGFPATGDPNMDDRDWETYATILSGDNEFRVISNNFTTTTALLETAVLDGFTLTDGQTSGVGHGGAILNNHASPTLANLKIIGNHAGGNGGGIFNLASSSPTLTNVIISGNVSQAYGGGIINSQSSPILTNVIISNNSCTQHGGGINNSSGSEPILINVEISGNTGVSGGGMYNLDSSPTLTNVTICSNAAQSGGGIYNGNSASNFNNIIVWGNTATSASDNIYSSSTLPPTFSYSLIEGSGGSGSWQSTYGINGGNNIDEAPVFTDPENSDYTLQPASPALNAGSNSLYAGLEESTVDLAGNPRVYDYNDEGLIDMGAYEYQGDALGSADWDMPDALSVYPNPVLKGNSMQVMGNLPEGEFSNIEIQLYSIGGKYIQTFIAPQQNTEIQVPAALASGIYLLKIETGNRVDTTKLIVN